MSNFPKVLCSVAPIARVLSMALSGSSGCQLFFNTARNFSKYHSGAALMKAAQVPIEFDMQTLNMKLRRVLDLHANVVHDYAIRNNRKRVTAVHMSLRFYSNSAQKKPDESSKKPNESLSEVPKEPNELLKVKEELETARKSYESDMSFQAGFAKAEAILMPEIKIREQKLGKQNEELERLKGQRKLLIQREATKGALVKAKLWHDYSCKTKYWRALPFSQVVDDLLERADAFAAHPQQEDDDDYTY